MMHSDKDIKEFISYAKEFGVNHIVDNFKVEKFIENNSDRCYYCKKEIFKTVKDIADKHNIKYVLDGTNLDDLGDFRPDLKALEELNLGGLHEKKLYINITLLFWDGKNVIKRDKGFRI